MIFTLVTYCGGGLWWSLCNKVKLRRKTCMLTLLSYINYQKEEVRRKHINVRVMCFFFFKYRIFCVKTLHALLHLSFATFCYPSLFTYNLNLFLDFQSSSLIVRKCNNKISCFIVPNSRIYGIKKKEEITTYEYLYQVYKVADIN